MRVNQHLSQLDEIAVRLIVHFDGSPRISSTSHLTTVGSGDEVVRTYDSKGHFALRDDHRSEILSSRMCLTVTYQDFLVLSYCLFIFEVIRRWLEDFDVVVGDIVENLGRQDQLCLSHLTDGSRKVALTLCLKATISSSVKVSALAITGIRLTL
jgi:hypothetical protein